MNLYNLSNKRKKCNIKYAKYPKTYVRMVFRPFKPGAYVHHEAGSRENQLKISKNSDFYR